MRRAAFYAALSAITRSHGEERHDAQLVFDAIEAAVGPCRHCFDTGRTASGYSRESWHDGQDCGCDRADRVTDDDLDARIEVLSNGDVRCLATGAVAKSGEPAVWLINRMRTLILAKREEAA